MSKVVHITGGTAGIGAETAILLASPRWKVVISGRRQEEGDSGGEASFILFDVSTEAAIISLIDQTVSLYSRIDGLKYLVAQKSGSIVNLASFAGLNGIIMTGTYAATKHAVAFDYGAYGITVNAIAPGPIKTDILRQAIDAGAYTEKSIADLVPMKRMGVPMDIARGSSFLLESPFATGRY